MMFANRDEFFKALSDEAARPDPKFIFTLQNKVVAIANGTPPPGGLNLPMGGLIAIGAVTLTILGGVTYGVVKNDPTPIANDQPAIVAVQETPEDTSVLGEVEETQEEVADDPIDTQEDEAVESSEPAVDPVQPSTPTTPSQPVSNPSTPPTTPPATPNENFSVEFWTVPLFKISPVIPSTPADFVEEVADLNYDWGQGSPDATITKNHFVARATASKILDSGRYTLSIAADDAVRVYIDGKRVLDRWEITPGGKDSKVSFSVASGSNATKIVIEYFEFQDSAHLKAEIIKH